MQPDAETIANYVVSRADAQGDHRFIITPDDHPNAPQALRGYTVQFNVQLQPGTFDGNGHDLWINGTVSKVDTDYHMHHHSFHIDTYLQEIQLHNRNGSSRESY